MAVIPKNPVFSDIQTILDSILANSSFENAPPPATPPLNPPPTHKMFWRQSGNYMADYKSFTVGNVPGVRGGNMPIMNSQKGKELTSNFFVVLVAGLPVIGQMPDGGPYITDAGYSIKVNGVVMSGDDIQDTLKYWLQNNYPS